MDKDMEQWDDEVREWRLDEITDVLQEYAGDIYPEMNDADSKKLAKRLVNYLTWSQMVGRPVDPVEKQSPMDVAIAITSTCVRNNTSLEDYHAYGTPIGQEEMKTLMQEITANIADWLLLAEVLAFFELWDEYNVLVNAGLKWDYGWETDRGKLPLE